MAEVTAEDRSRANLILSQRGTYVQLREYAELAIAVCREEAERRTEERVRAECAARIAELESHRVRLDGQIQELADFIMCEVPGEPSRKERVVDAAMRVMRARDKRIAELETDLRRMTKLQELTSQACSEYRREVESLKEQLAAKRSKLESRATSIDALQHGIGSMETEISTLKLALKDAIRYLDSWTSGGKPIESTREFADSWRGSVSGAVRTLAAAKPMLTAEEDTIVDCVERKLPGYHCDAVIADLAALVRKHTTPHQAKQADRKPPFVWTDEDKAKLVPGATIVSHRFDIPLRHEVLCCEGGRVRLGTTGVAEGGNAPLEYCDPKSILTPIKLTDAEEQLRERAREEPPSYQVQRGLVAALDRVCPPEVKAQVKPLSDAELADKVWKAREQGGFSCVDVRGLLVEVEEALRARGGKCP